MYLEKIRKLLDVHNTIEVRLSKSSFHKFKKLIVEYCESKQSWHETWITQLIDGSIEKMRYIYFELDPIDGKIMMTQTRDDEYREACDISLSADEFFDIEKGKKKKLDL